MTAGARILTADPHAATMRVMSIHESGLRVTIDKLPLLRRYLESRDFPAPEEWFSAFAGEPNLESWLGLQRRLAMAMDDPDFGLAFGAWFPGMPSLLGHLLSTCKTAGEALQAFIRYQRLEHSVWHLDLEPVSDGMSIRYQAAHPLADHRLMVDFAFASLLSAGERLTGNTLRPAHACLAYARPSRVADLMRHFGPELKFEADENRLVIAKSDLQRPVLGASDPARAALEAPLAAGLAILDGSRKLSSRIMPLLGHGEDRCFNLAEISQRLSLSPRRVQQGLQVEGTSFMALRDAFRRDEACRLLCAPELTIKEIAGRLGFSEPSAFHRAFHRWTGHSPAAWRRLREC